ncbi:MAG: ATP-binding cassette domain-containing protein [Pseudomonadales bacterium]
MIRIEALCKSFGTVTAIRDVAFTAADGRVTALLGPNGAGKSTTLRILSTVLAPDSGSAHVGEFDVARDPMNVRRTIGVLPHATGLYGRLTARENIAYYGALHGLKGKVLDGRITSLTELLEMEDILSRRVAGFSQGQRIKVALARALIHDPRHLLLDEPTNGLDVMATRALRQIILKLKAEGRCVLFSSHIMQEVTNLCDDVVIVGGGRVRFQGGLDELRARSGETDLEDAFIRMVGSGS